MIAELKEKTVKTFTKLLDENKGLDELLSLVNTGSLDYLGLTEIAERMGNILHEAIESNIGMLSETEITEEFIGEFLESYLEPLFSGNEVVISQICKSVQGDLNVFAGIGLGVREPKGGRFSSIEKAIKEAVTFQNLKSASLTDAVSFGMAVVDGYATSNAQFQANLGLPSTIVRTWKGTYSSHDTKHTDFCSKLAGVYEYEDAKDGRNAKIRNSALANVFSRHKGCRCKVMYFPEGSSKGRITSLAKGEKDRDKSLWNTGKKLDKKETFSKKKVKETLKGAWN